MKIICESCSAQYDLDESRIPPSGLTMKCPACLHSFLVRRPGVMVSAPPTIPTVPVPPKVEPPKPREIELSPLDMDDETPPPAPLPTDEEDLIDLPAPKMEEIVDLPAPKAARSSSSPGTRSSDEIVDLPAPRRPSGPKLPAVEETPDLPAPKRAVGKTKSSTHLQVGISLDAPDPDDARGPDHDVGPPAIALAGEEVIDVVAPRHEVLDVVAPRGPAPRADARTIDDHLDVVAPRRAPGASDDVIDVVAPRRAPGASDDVIDVVAPRAEVIDVVQPRAELPVPKPETLELAPKAETYDVAPRAETFEVAPRPETTDVAPRAAAGLPSVAEPLAPAKPAVAKPAKPPRTPSETRRGPRALIAAAAIALVIGAVGIGLGVFTSSGYFGANLFSGGGGKSEARLLAARKLLTDDTLASYRKAALDLHALVEAQPKAVEAMALEAQAHLAVARLGQASEKKAADALLARLDADPAAAAQTDSRKAHALKLVVAGALTDGRARLNDLLAQAPSDAAALVYLGWTEEAAGDDAAAEKAFAKALAAEPNRPAALYGDGVFKERMGNASAARELYAKALAKSPQHFGAAVGQARLAPDGAAKIEALIAARASTVGASELADAWTSIGVAAAAVGRRDEAEDRLKRALALDGDWAPARVAISLVQCDTGRCKDALAPLRKLVAAQPKNFEARLALVRALVETAAVAEAKTVLAPAVASDPKSPRVLYWQGRLLLADEPADPKTALAKFQDATTADPKLIPAWLAQSATLAALGKPDEALAALKRAEAETAGDPDLMMELGRAYLDLGKAPLAAERFRAALEKKPDDLAARVALGGALEAEGKLDEAQKEYDAVAAKNPELPGLAERQARLSVKAGRPNEAWELYQRALKQGVPTQGARLGAAALALETGRLDEGQKLAESVLHEDERSAPAHLLVARAQLANGHADEALIEARHSATIADAPEAHLTLGRALETLGRLDQAVNEYALARRAPVENEAALGRARVLVRMGASRDALAEVQNILHDKKLRSQALVVAGDSYADQQQADRARHAYEDASAADDKNAEAAFKYGRALHDAARRKPAAVELERAIKLGGDKAPWAAEAYLILGDAHREVKEDADAVRAYKKYLELAPPEAPERAEVNRHLAILGGH